MIGWSDRWLEKWMDEWKYWLNGWVYSWMNMDHFHVETSRKCASVAANANVFSSNQFSQFILWTHDPVRPVWSSLLTWTSCRWSAGCRWPARLQLFLRERFCIKGKTDKWATGAAAGPNCWFWFWFLTHRQLCRARAAASCRNLPGLSPLQPPGCQTQNLIKTPWIKEEIRWTGAETHLGVRQPAGHGRVTQDFCKTNN